MAKKKAELKTSVKSYQHGVNLEKQKICTYAKKMGTNVKSLQTTARSLQGEFKNYSKEMEIAGRNMIEEGNRHMNLKVGKFKGEITNQIKENKEAIAHIENGVKLFISDINKKKKDFQAYARGPFNNSIKAFWG